MSTHWIVIDRPLNRLACGAALSEFGTRDKGLVTCLGCMSFLVGTLCNAVEPVPGPLPARCALPPHDDEEHDWVPGAEVRHRAQLAQNALATETAAAISATRAGAGARLPSPRALVRRVVERWPA